MDNFNIFFLQLLLLTVSKSSPVIDCDRKSPADVATCTHIVHTLVIDCDRKSPTDVATGTHVVQAQHNALFKAEGCGS